MPVTQTIIKEDLYRRILDLPDSDVARVLEFVNGLEEYEPNAETAAALKESLDMRNLIGPFRINGVEDFMRALSALDSDLPHRRQYAYS